MLSYLLVGGATLTFIYLIYKLLTRPKVYNDPPNVVILCQFPRGPMAPSVSPFCLKLETYLRMTKIPYTCVTDRGMSKKVKSPFIYYNGEQIADSQFCINFLNKKFEVDLDKDLSIEMRAIARAFRKTVEESMYWGLLINRFCGKLDMDYMQMSWRNKMPTLLIWYIAWAVKKSAYGQGMSRHSESEVNSINLADMKAISDYLGDKPFLMGKTPTEVDCSVFGMLAQFRWHCPGSVYEKAITEDYRNLNAYLLRMKDTFWQDWDDCIHHNNTKDPKK